MSGRPQLAPLSVIAGPQAGFSGQGTGAIAIGYGAGATGQGQRAVAIGYQAGFVNQAADSVAIGPGAAVASQPPRSIVINADPDVVLNPGSSGLYIHPIHQQDANIYLVGQNINTEQILRSNTVISTTGGAIGIGTTGINPEFTLTNSASLYYNFNNTLAAITGGSQYNLSASGTTPGSLTYAAGPSGIYDNALSLPNTVAGAAVCYAINNTTQNLIYSTINTTGVSVSCWFYLTSAPSAGTYPTIWTTAAAGQHLEFGVCLNETTNLLLARMVLSTGSNLDLQAATSPISTNTWYHLVLTVGNGTFSMFLNGVFNRSVSFANNARTLNATQFVIGGGGTSTTNVAFPGRVDEFRVFNYPLTLSQIQALYTLTTPTPVSTISTAIPPYGVSVSNGPLGVVDQNAINPEFTLTNSTSIYYNLNSNLNATTGGSQYNLAASGPQVASITYGAGPTGTYGTALQLSNPTTQSIQTYMYAINSTTQNFFVPLLSTSGASVSCWCYPTTILSPGTNVWPTLWTFAIAGDHGDFTAFIDTTLGFTCRYKNSAGSATDITTSSLGIMPVVNTWYHVVVTFSTTTMTLYVNGQFLKSAAVSSPRQTSTMFVVGGASPTHGGSVGWIGRLDDLRIFNSPLTSAQVSSLYTLTTPTPTATTPTIGLAIDPATGAVTQNNLPAAFCRAWVTFSASTAGIVILDSFNVSSVSRTSQGVFALTFTTPMSDVGYTFNISTGRDSTATTSIPAAVGMLSGSALTNQLRTGFNFYISEITPAALVDPSFVCVTVVDQ